MYKCVYYYARLICGISSARRFDGSTVRRFDGPTVHVNYSEPERHTEIYGELVKIYYEFHILGIHCLSLNRCNRQIRTIYIQVFIYVCILGDIAICLFRNVNYSEAETNRKI